MMRTAEHTIGSFMTNSCLIVTDPCYNYDTRQILENVMPGEWIAEVKTSDEGTWGNRVAELRVFNIEADLIRDYEWRRVSSIDVGVDSGQAGFFDSFMYPRGDTGDFDDKDSFYGKVCDLTLSTKNSAGVLSFGAVSSTGYGDGCYDLYTVTRDGKIVGAKIVFIGEEEDYEDEDYSEEE